MVQQVVQKVFSDHLVLNLPKSGPFCRFFETQFWRHAITSEGVVTIAPAVPLVPVPSFSTAGSGGRTAGAMSAGTTAGAGKYQYNSTEETPLVVELPETRGGVCSEGTRPPLQKTKDREEHGRSARNKGCLF